MRPILQQYSMLTLKSVIFHFSGRRRNAGSVSPHPRAHQFAHFHLGVALSRCKSAHESKKILMMKKIPLSLVVVQSRRPKTSLFNLKIDFHFAHLLGSMPQANIGEKKRKNWQMTSSDQSIRKSLLQTEFSIKITIFLSSPYKGH